MIRSAIAWLRNPCRFGHKMQYTPSHLVAWCVRPGCDHYWEYD